ncbi:MAG: hypothetical protein IJS15_14595, partial [Victivallales bacterium]|nr:hypothetical protein [Victivallales bacterium]
LDPNEWKAKRDEIAAMIRKEVVARAQKIVTHDKIVNVGFNNEINALRGIIDVSVIENKPGLKYGLKNDADAFERKLYNELKRQRDYFYKTELKKWENNMMPKYPKFDFQPKQPPTWSVPIPKPPKKLEQLKEEMEQKLEKIFTDAYRLKSEEELFAEGREKFKLITITEDNPRPYVKFTLRGGKGSNTAVEGVLQRITGERLQVQGRWIIRSDLDFETQAMLYKDANNKKIKDYVDTEIRKYNAIKDNFVSDWTMYLLPDEYMQNYYIPIDYLVKNKKQQYFTVLRQSTNVKKWMSRYDYENFIYNTLLEKVKKAISHGVEVEFYTHAKDKDLYSENFEYVADLKEWMPNSVAQAHREEQQRALQQQQNGEMGPDGGMGPDFGPGPGPGPDGGPGPR